MNQKPSHVLIACLLIQACALGAHCQAEQPETTAAAQPESDRAAISREAMKVLDEFMHSFNRMDVG